MEAKAPGPTDFRLSDPFELSRNMARAFETAARIANIMAGRPNGVQQDVEAQVTPIEQVVKTLGDVAMAYLANPQRLAQAQLKLWQGHTQLWTNFWRRLQGEAVEPVVSPERGDKRFKDPDWETNQLFDFLKQSYLVTANWAKDLIAEAQGLDEHTQRKARFYVEQIMNALSPTNFALTNPEVLKLTFSTNGQNLVDGLEMLERDLRHGGGRLRISQTNAKAFEVGKNLATTPGKVIFENDVFQLIQYEPATENVRELPLLIVPPWINKYYILDLSPKKSFIRWAVAQGLTVFVVSWINPDEAHSYKTFADYMNDGFLTALDLALKATKQKKANVIGYCVGGSLVAASLAYMAQKNDTRVNSVTFLAAQVDFEKAGDLLVYVDEDQVKWIESRMAEKGYLPGRRMADAFNLLRSNDLIWSYVINNYMLGKEPTAFDLLYWNSDGTRMPANVHSFYLRECYLHNRLSKGKMTLDGVRLDLRKVKLPVYNLATRDDHISPLASVFRLGNHFGGPVKLVVAASGHIAGVVNPPEAQKYQYWTNEDGAPTLEEWWSAAEEHPGSWWPDWSKWIDERSGKMVKARRPGDGPFKIIEDAPGRYVKVKGE
jgi:poly[(R)-3-hydroxyalkanoate] polymerase subunit PhaC